MMVIFILQVIVVITAARDFKNYEFSLVQTYDFKSLLNGQTLQDYYSVNSNTMILKTPNSIKILNPKDPIFYTSIPIN